MANSLRRVLHALTALGLLTATVAGLAFLSLRAARTGPGAREDLAAGPGPAVVVLEAADDPGGDAFTTPVAVALGLDPDLLPFPASDAGALASPHRRHSAADLAAAGPFGFELLRRRDRGQRLTVSLIAGVARQVLGNGATLADLEDGDGDGRDDDGRFTLMSADGSAACVSLGAARPVARALGLPVDPGDGTAASGYSWDPHGPCSDGSDPAYEAGAPDGSTPGVFGASAAGEVCDVPLLLRLLASDPAAMQAWALARGIPVSALEGYVAGLTPVILLQDTLVTDHGYSSGRAIPRRAVLQRGTALLVDPRGEPVARCLSGSPLQTARPLADDPEVVGTAWEGFRRAAVVEVSPAGRPASEFVLLDVLTGLPLRRQPGSAGAAPTLAGPVVALEG
jgi:hypothetical protein